MIMTCGICGGTGVARVGFDGLTRIGAGAWACVCPAGALALRQAQGARARAAVGNAGIPPLFAEMTLDTLLAKKRKSISHVQGVREAREWCALQERQPPPDKFWLLVKGKTGMGKTGLAVGVLKVLAEQGHTGLFLDTSEMFEEMKRRFGGDVESYTSALKQADALVVDEFVPKQVTEWKRQVLFDLVRYRAGHRKITIFTTLADWPEMTNTIGEDGARRMKEFGFLITLQGKEVNWGE